MSDMSKFEIGNGTVHHMFQNFEAMCPKQTKTVITMQIWLCTTLQWIKSNSHTISVLCQMCGTRHIYFKLVYFFLMIRFHAIRQTVETVSFTHLQLKKMLWWCKISGSHGSDYKDCCPKGCDLSLFIVYFTLSIAIQCWFRDVTPYSLVPIYQGVRGGAVGWGTTLQTGT
jgi:hypothetical protein